MADLFRIVTVGADGRRRLVEDLEVVDVVYSERDSRTFTLGEGAPSSASSSSRYGGSFATGEQVSNGRVGATLAVRGPDPAAAAATVERLLERVRSSRRDLYIEWRPENLQRSALSPIRGPGTASVNYRWVEWAGARRIGVPVSWPTAPLVEDLPLAIYERFAPPNDKTLGAINLLGNPNGQVGSSGYTALATSGTAGIGGVGSAGYLTGDVDFQRYGFRSELAGGGAGTWTIAQPAGSSAQYVRDGSPPIVPGRYYAVRARVKIATQFVNAGSQILLNLRCFTAAGVAGTGIGAASTPALAGTYTAGTVLELAGIVQAPAGVAYAGPELLVVVGAASSGVAIVGNFLVAEVRSPSSSVPAYGDGDGNLYRWEGQAGNSRSVELSEPKLADYTRLPVAGGTTVVERTTEAGVYQEAGVGSLGARLAHTSRLPVADGEVLVGGRLITASGAGVGYDHFLTPGLKYGADGSYVWATTEAGNLVIYYYNGTTNVAIATAALPPSKPTAGDTTYHLALRAEGNQFTADWYGSGVDVPDADRTGYSTRVRGTVYPGPGTTSADLIGAGRVGAPMLRAWPMNTGGVAIVTRFEWRPFMRTDQRLPVIVPVKGIPGTAPALLRPSLHLPRSMPSAQAFGMFSWARRAARENLAVGGATGTGTDRSIDQFTSVNTSPTYTSSPSPAGTPLQGRLTAFGAGATSSIWRHYRLFKRGQPVTVDMWTGPGADATVWTVEIEMTDTAGGTTLTAFTTRAGNAAWLRNVQTIYPTVDLIAVGIKFSATATAGTNAIRFAALNIWEGDPRDAPTTDEQTRGRGANAPLAIIQGEAFGAVSGPWSLGAEDPTELLNRSRLRYQVQGANADVANPLSYNNEVLAWLDPYLVDPPDFAGDTIDVVVFAMGTIDTGIPRPMMRVAARHEADAGQSSRIYSREFGATGRTLFPFTTALAQRGGYVTRLGTLSIPRRGGRVALLLTVGHTGATVGQYIGIDAVIVAPAWALASTPTGKAHPTSSSTYPLFAPRLLTQEFAGTAISHERRFRPDGSGITVPTGYQAQALGGDFPYGTIGGEPMELTPGDASLLAWCYPNVPDNTALGNNEGITGRNGVGPNAPAGGGGPSNAAVSVDVTPRYRLLPA